ncbi:sphingomyelin phosphodiesterase isoform X2 [Folsomia candida]|nr:sphingomyelin phosphodiesterase isoform X2 [Folsomia candida]
MVVNKPEIPDDDFCGIINPGCRPISAPVRDWSITLSPPKGPKTRKTLPKDGLPAQTELTKILQFTDVHLDLDYVPGTDSGCGLPACCRDGIPTNPDNSAGKWGHFSCEMPESGLKALYKHGANTHSDAKFIFLTGDYIHSNIWLYGVDENTRHHVAVTTWLQSTFASTAPEIYPLVGNHEPDVVNMYPPEETWGDFPLRWMYHSVGDAFGDFLPADQMELFLKYGYYTVISKADPNLRIIALNTNLCYVNNFWLPYEPIDTSGQLQWFADRLQEAEDAGQAVFLLGHIFPGSGSCWPIWSRQFERIIQRYSYTIRAQWYGHSHEQDYHITFSEDDAPVSLSFTGGSGVTDGMNPGYNVFYADGQRGADSTWEIVNHQSIVLNLTVSNALPDEAAPIFSTILDAQEAWGVTSLTAETVHDLIYRMVCDDALFLEYQKVVTKGADSPRFNPCLRNDYRCKANVLGGLFVSNSGDHSHRDRLTNYILTVDCKEQNPPTTTPGSTEGTTVGTTEGTTGGTTEGTTGGTTEGTTGGTTGGTTAGTTAGTTGGSTEGSTTGGTTEETEGTTAGSGGKSVYFPLFLAVLIKFALALLNQKT